MGESASWPAPLVAPATVAVISPAGPIAEEALQRGVACLEARGFRVRVGAHALDRTAYLAGSDADRLADLYAAWEDPAVDAVWCSRGGYGVLRLLDMIDWSRLARPLPLVGYSDITALQLAWYARHRCVSFSGPMVASLYGYGREGGIEPASEDALWAWLGERQLPRALVNPDGAPLQVVQPGVAEGPLLGGCLSLVSSLVGTPYLPALRGAILVLEDVNESPYRIDGLLTRLRLAGHLDEIAGLVLADFSDCFAPAKAAPGWPLVELVQHLLGDRRLPVVAGLQYGHLARRGTLPIGAWARLETAEPSLTVIR